ncbi:hypothetical protein CCACVL1_28178 [Corchorus capsularis]|uniref:Uncharacterized protein n=1 Tax=Corchorus capsularis TaxID=210143 RepID=A0A1R3G7A0_COCAP|nr:hypothetical protein CCACVL1_28178 [Corchorus capsularis]
MVESANSSKPRKNPLLTEAPESAESFSFEAMLS